MAHSHSHDAPHHHRHPAADVEITGNYYELFGIPKDATQQQLKKAYLKLSLKVHPDRNKGHEEEATKKFQALGRIYNALSDPERRKIYDETGEIEDEAGDPSDESSWLVYWRQRFPQVTKEQIINFEKEFKGSEEEKEQILEAYKTHKGSMDGVIDDVWLATLDDEERLRGIIQDAINAGQVRGYKAFTKETAASKAARKSRLDEEAAEAKAYAVELGLDKASPHHLISAKMKKRNESLIASLESKYGGKKKKGGGSGSAAAAAEDENMEDPLDDAEFARIQAEMEAQRKTRKKK